MTRFNIHKVLGWTAGTMATAAIVTGIIVAGSPSEERSRRLDDQRSENLMNIHSLVESYAQSHGQVPESLDEIDYQYQPRELSLDPETSVPLSYEVVTDKSYEICAQFAAVGTETDQWGNKRPMISKLGGESTSFWKHDAGETCWTLDVALIGDLCGNDKPCPVSQTCLILPGDKTAHCVDEQLYCRAAKCEGSCSLNKSNPPQVVCDDVKPDETKITKISCSAFQEPETGKVVCFNCMDGECSQVPEKWLPYEPTGDVGIPYSCFMGENGCELAQ